MENPMDTVAFQKVTTSAADITKTVVAGQVKLLDIYAKNSEGMPISSFFNAAATVQRATLQNLDNLAASLLAAPAKSTGAPIKAAADLVKNAVNAQADALIKTDASTIVAASKVAAKSSKKPASSAAKDDLSCTLDDLTVVSGIGPSTMKKLQAEGIQTLLDLAKISNKELTALVEKANIRLLKNTPADWISDAKKQVKSLKK